MFSDRMGYTKRGTIQFEKISDDLRNSLWNVTLELLQGNWMDFTDDLQVHFFKQPVDELDRYGYDFERTAWLKKLFFSMEWYEVYNLLEYVAQHAGSLSRSVGDVENTFNRILERELSGYRLIRGLVAPITDKVQIGTIEEAASAASDVGFHGVTEHLEKALDLLGKKPSPDYRNSIKESISAVEGTCKLVTGEKSGGLKLALEKLSEKAHLHPALVKGLLSLYGYTSDEDGIRHPILEGKEIGLPETQLMLVLGSALVSFIIEKARKAGLI